jgi:hypothetical protein
MFKRNSMWFGILIGMLLPLIVYGLLFVAVAIYKRISGSPAGFDEAMLQLISPVINLFLIRYYFVTKKYDDSGRGVLLVTFVFVIAFFVINRF